MVSGLTKHTTDQGAQEISEVIGAHQMIPHTPVPDVARLLTAASAHLVAALKWKTGAAANLQLAQVASQTDPGEEANAALRVAHAALDAAEAAEDRALREVASYRLRVAQAEDGHD